MVAATSRAEVDRALREGEIVRDARGRYAVPIADRSRRVASALAGVVSHRSAALLWGWQVKVVPELPDVMVPPNRNVGAAARSMASVHWGVTSAADVVGGVTSPGRTLVDCLRVLPFDEGLAVADSALRVGTTSKAGLVDLMAQVRGAGAARCRRVAAAADGRAANPFESVLRAIGSDIPNLQLTPQVVLDLPGATVRPDLVDERRRVVVEADSFAWHGSRSALRRDCRRYNDLVLAGWTVLRFSWEDVMHDPDYVRACLERLVSDVPERVEGTDGVEPAA